MNYWAGVFVGFMCSLLLMAVVCIGVTDRMSQYEVALEQLSKKEDELKNLYAEHEKIIKQYEFYVWHNMKFFEEKEE